MTIAHDKRQLVIGFSVILLFLSITYFIGIKNALIFDDSLLLEDGFRQTYGGFILSLIHI